MSRTTIGPSTISCWVACLTSSEGGLPLCGERIPTITTFSSSHGSNSSSHDMQTIQDPTLPMRSTSNRMRDVACSWKMSDCQRPKPAAGAAIGWRPGNGCSYRRCQYNSTPLAPESSESERCSGEVALVLGCDSARPSGACCPCPATARTLRPGSWCRLRRRDRSNGISRILVALAATGCNSPGHQCGAGGAQHLAAAHQFLAKCV